MAWTTPKTWADGDIPDADDLNTHIKDNLNAVSTHAHSGAAGDGSADLSGLDTETFDNQGSTPAAPGSNKVKLFSESETLKIRAGASGAAVAIALASHSHTIADSTSHAEGLYPNNGVGNDTYEQIHTHTRTPADSTGSAKYVTVQIAVLGIDRVGAGTADTTVRLLKGGVQVASTVTSMVYPNKYTVIVSFYHGSLAASSTVFTVEAKAADGGLNATVLYSGHIVREIRCQ
jgi:hypothetical protein